jgi:hypothetical protein
MANGWRVIAGIVVYMVAMTGGELTFGMGWLWKYYTVSMHFEWAITASVIVFLAMYFLSKHCISSIVVPFMCACGAESINLGIGQKAYAYVLFSLQMNAFYTFLSFIIILGLWALIIFITWAIIGHGFIKDGKLEFHPFDPFSNRWMGH